MLPCGAPQLTMRAVNSLPLKLYLWVRPLAYNEESYARWSHDQSVSMISWSMVSNALLLRSIKTRPFKRPLSLFTDQTFVVSSKAVSVPWRDQNPDRQPSNNLLSSIMVKLIVNNSQKLSKLQGLRTDIGLYLVVRIITLAPNITTKIRFS